MCGIVGAIAERDIYPILLEGLKRLEYRGYDSAGLVVVDRQHSQLQRRRAAGKVAALQTLVAEDPPLGYLGIAHTRWATHGAPNQDNAHPHISTGKGIAVAVVHNGIIENFYPLKQQLQQQGYQFTSDTDTEVVAHLLHAHLSTGLTLRQAVQAVIKQIHGAYALGVINLQEPHLLVTARAGSPLVIGCGIGENFIASDHLALQPVTNRFIYLHEGDIAELSLQSIHIWDRDGKPQQRPIEELDGQQGKADKGEYRHFMLKEIYEQPMVVRQTLADRLMGDQVSETLLGEEALALLPKIKSIQIVACGTSYHAGLVARYWFEELAGIHCQVEIASEFRYRHPVVMAETLFITLSQSGETADTLAALRQAKTQGYLATLAICNVKGASLVRESQLALMTNAGPEIGVASTKAFTSQLVALSLLVILIGKHHGLSDEQASRWGQALRTLPNDLEKVLALDHQIEQLAEYFRDKHHALFLGRGSQYPVAMEGALKLKEISYIHAEAYAAGELKHGPLALVDENMPVIAVAPQNDLLEKLQGNLQEVHARGGELTLFCDAQIAMTHSPKLHLISIPSVLDWVAPIVYTIPLQLLSYHVALIKGTDVDQPRNLAKSVTVE
jgi:glucosamine--fructose-6-phosphate aminotransferase (isomerizing)